MSIRGNLARRSTGGPQFRLRPDRVVIELDGRTNLSKLASDAQEQADEYLEDRPVQSHVFEEVGNSLHSMGMVPDRLTNVGVIVAKVDDMENVLKTIEESQEMFGGSISRQAKQAIRRARNRNSRTQLGGFTPGMLNFGQREKASLEANIRNELSNISLNNVITKAVEQLEGVVSANIDYTRYTPGPRSLNINIADEARTVTGESDKPDVGDAIRKFNGHKAWGKDTGDGAVAAIFDTSFCREFLSSDRVIDTFSGDDVESAYSAPEEGHGTMTAYSMAGDTGTSGLGYNGVAKDADLLLGRLSNKDGGLAYTAEAWDWLISWVKELDKPVISNHSYGVPLCSARTMNNCESTTTKLARVANRRSDHQAFYAAGNEGIYCGHRLSGATNGINGINSDPTSITCGAFRYDLVDAQTYSSHGFGTCSSAGTNPKPDLGCLLPDIVPYGCEEKDMSTGNGGSSGGTSEATPLTAGVATLLASKAGTADLEVLQDTLESTAKQVRPTQINAIRGHDARFGHGQVMADEAMDYLIENYV